MPDRELDRHDVFALPSLGADMDFGSVIEWRVAPGDTVNRGDVVAVVETEKADIDVEIWQDGTVAELLLEVGREVPVGTPMLRLGAKAPESVSTPPVQTPAATASAPPGEQAGIEAPLASPFARARAVELGIDLRGLSGTGPGGAVLVADVEAAAAAPTSEAIAPASTTSRRPEISGDGVRSAKRAEGMRRAIAERMALANRDIPHYQLDVDVDLGPMLDALERHNASLPIGERLLPAAMFLAAAASAAAAHPECNGTWIDGGFVAAPSVDLAVAISLRKGGLVTPVITAADTRSTTEIMALLKELVTAARSGSLKSSWMVDGSLTVTNLGDNGADRVHGVVFPPQVALVGFGRIKSRPWAVDGVVAIRPSSVRHWPPTIVRPMAWLAVAFSTHSLDDSNNRRSHDRPRIDHAHD